MTPWTRDSISRAQMMVATGKELIALVQDTVETSRADIDGIAFLSLVDLDGDHGSKLTASHPSILFIHTERERAHVCVN